MTSYIPQHIQDIINKLDLTCKTNKSISGIYKNEIRNNFMTRYYDETGFIVKEVFCDGRIGWYYKTQLNDSTFSIVNSIWIEPSNKIVSHFELVSNYTDAGITYKKVYLVKTYKDSKLMHEQKYSN